MSSNKINLVTAWRSIETTDTNRDVNDALNDLNSECKTNFGHSELGRIARGDRNIKPHVVNCMQKIVLTNALLDLGINEKQIKRVLEKIELPDTRKF